MSVKLEVRCFCRHRPLLAICGRDEKSRDPFIHVKSSRGNRINAEVVVTSGVIRLRCRDCLRWHTIRIVKTNIEQHVEDLPASLGLKDT